MSKKVILLLMAVMLSACALLAGCGSSDAPKEQAKVLNVGTNADFAPFEFTDGKSNEFQGFDMDLIRAVGKEMGYEVKIQNINFDGLIPALQAGNIDLIAAGMSITPERQQTVLFSEPYYTSGLTILVDKNNNTIKNFKDLEGKKIAVQIGTSSQDEAQKVKNGQVKAMNSSADTFVELQSGHVDAVINDKPVNAYYMKQTQDAHVKTLDVLLESQQYGFAMRKDDKELAEKVNKALTTLKQNGEYTKIYKKWFGEDPSPEDLKS